MILKYVLGLTLNNAKSEIICEDHEVRGRVITALPGAMVVDPQKACLLESPSGDVACIDATLEKKIQALNTMGTRFPYLSSHDALSLCCGTLLPSPSSTTSYDRHHVSCLGSWQSMTQLYVPSSALSPTPP